MKNTIITGFFGIAAAIIAVIIGYHLTKENIDIRYTLSGSIPAKFLDEGNLRNIQQLDIVNKGDKSAEKIRIKLNRNVSQFELTKYSELDVVKEQISDKGLEIIYPELPPEGKMKVVFSSENSPILDENIDITHSKGSGKEALEADKSFFNSGAGVVLFYGLIFSSYLIFQILEIRNRWIERDAQWGDEKIFLRLKAPWFLSVDRWNKLRKEAIQNHLEKSSLTLSDFEKSKVVSFLNSDKQEYFSDYEWEFVINKSQDIIEKRLPSLLDFHYFFHGTAENFYKITKPKNFLINKWDDILSKIHKLYMNLEKERALNASRLFRDPPTVYSQLVTDNKYGVPESLWADYQNLLKKIFLYTLTSELSSKFANHLEYINQYDLNVLDGFERKFIQDVAYVLQYNTKNNLNFSLDTAHRILREEKEDWIKDEDQKNLLKRAREVVRFHDEHAKIESFLNLFHLICSRKKLPEEKPGELTQKEWESLKNLDESVTAQLIKIEENLSENEKVLSTIEQKEKSIPSLMEKLNRQLQIINEFLSDPTALDRIESYNNPFAPGNFSNLQKIADYLNRAQKHTEM